MKALFVFGIALLLITSSALAGGNFRGRPITNNIDMPTGYTLKEREFTVGLSSSIGFGVTDNVQVGTNVLLYLLQYYNANAKVNLVKSPNIALATGIGLGGFDLDVLGIETNFTSVSPYIALSTRVSKATTLHLSGQYSHFSNGDDIHNAEPDEIATGTSVSAGLDYSLSHRTKFLLETSYDATFDGFRTGGAVLFAWKRLRLKLGAGYYDPEGRDSSFTLPVFGLWWRFDA